MLHQIKTIKVPRVSTKLVTFKQLIFTLHEILSSTPLIGAFCASNW